MPFGLWTRVGQRKHKFNRIRQVAPMCPHGRAHLCQPVNIIEPFVCGAMWPLCQITLTTCYNYTGQQQHIQAKQLYACTSRKQKASTKPSIVVTTNFWMTINSDRMTFQTNRIYSQHTKTKISQKIWRLANCNWITSLISITLTC